MFLEAFEKRIAADAAVIGNNLKDALHNLEVLAARTVAKCLQSHDATPAAQELHAAVEALKSAGLAAAKDAEAALNADVKTDVPAAEAVAVTVAGAAAADAAAKHPERIVPDAIKALANAPLTTEIADQVADVIANAGEAVVDKAVADLSESTQPVAQKTE